MKMKLKNKLMVGVSTMLIIVMLLSTLVVSIMINKQNREASNDLLKKSFDVIRDAISERQTKLLSYSHQMSTINNMGGKIKYIAENCQLRIKSA